MTIVVINIDWPSRDPIHLYIDVAPSHWSLAQGMKHALPGNSIFNEFV